MGIGKAAYLGPTALLNRPEIKWLVMISNIGLYRVTQCCLLSTFVCFNTALTATM